MILTMKTRRKYLNNMYVNPQEPLNYDTYIRDIKYGNRENVWIAKSNKSNNGG